MREPTGAERAVDEYVDQLMRGSAPPLEEFLELHPELEEADRARLEKLARVLGGARAPRTGAVPFERLGPYRLVERLGAGGMGIVFRAEDERLGREVALKLLRPELAASPDAEARFEREARAVARLAHPNIVTVYEAGRIDGVAYLAMELVRGASLDQLFAAAAREHRRVHEREFLRWMRDVARALHAAHAVGIVHRDVKPSNVRVTPEGRALLLDFGLARAADSKSLSRTGEIHGTLYYVAPELIAGGRPAVDARCDVWSLGVTLYEGLAGRVPFEGEHSQAVLHRILAAEPVAPRALVPGLSRDLENVVLAALEKEPERRYATAALLADDLDAVLEHRPVRARPTGPVTRAWKWTRRKPAHATAAVLAAALALGVPISYGVVQGRNAEALRVEKELATREKERAEARTRDLEEMARFQGEVLGAVAPSSMAERIVGEFAAELAHDADAAQQLQALLSGVNTTNVAVATLRAEVLQPMIAATRARFADRPHVQGMVLHTIGVTCWSLGFADLALESQHTAFATLSSALPMDDPDVLATRANLGWYLLATGEALEAEPHLRAAADGLAQKLGRTDAGAMGARHNLAMLLRSLGKHAEAESVLRSVLADRRVALGDDAPDTLASLSNLGALLLVSGRKEEAEPILREAWERRRRILGPGADATLGTANNLGILQRSLGDTSRAELTLGDAHAAARASLGDLHATTTALAVALADAQIASGCHADALALLDSAVADAEQAGGPVGTETLYARSRLAGLLRELHRHAEAIEQLEAVRLELETSIGSEARDARACMKELAELYAEAGRHADAADVLEVLARAAALERGPTDELAQRHAAEAVRSRIRARHFDAAERALDDARSRLGTDVAPSAVLVEAALELYRAWGGGANGPHAAQAAVWRAFASGSNLSR